MEKKFQFGQIRVNNSICISLWEIISLKFIEIVRKTYIYALREANRKSIVRVFWGPVGTITFIITHPSIIMHESLFVNRRRSRLTEARYN